ncbi:MAG: prolyl oligopeptidase family serine peptidase, partial [Planctomycetota bacterium]
MKFAMAFVVCAAIAVTACTAGAIRMPIQQPPVTKINPVTDVLHGVAVVDPYRWLEGDNVNAQVQGQVTPEVSAWTAAQNAYTRSVVDNVPGRAQVEARLRVLMETSSVSMPIVRSNRYFYTKREGHQNQAVLYGREGVHGEPRTLLDPVTLDPTGLTTLAWSSPSEDGKLLAYGTYRRGDEITTLHILDVETGVTSPLAIPNRVNWASWLPDGSGFVYKNLKNPTNPYSGQVLFHAMDTDMSSDKLLFRQFTKEENEKLATTWGPSGNLSRDGHWLILNYSVNTKSSDCWLVDFDAFRSSGTMERREVTVGVEGAVSATVRGGMVYMHTTKGAPRGRLAVARVEQPGYQYWTDLVAERSDAVMTDVDFGQDAFVVTWSQNASNTIEVFDYSGTSRGLMTLPGIGSAAVSANAMSNEAFVYFQSFNVPVTIYRADLSQPVVQLDIWERPAVPVDPTIAEVEQVWYPSKDGTQISMFLAHRKGQTLTSQMPTILTGYGGFGLSETPRFSAVQFQWFEAGGMIAIPNLRGGGEYGDAWHEAGMLAQKQNVFDDFIAAAEWLIAKGYTNSDHLAIVGGSNGGLLTGAVTTQRPELFRAAIVAVPLLDMLRYQQFSMARYWVPEYGSAENAEQFRYLMAYSPYHHVQKGARYPAVFLTAGEHDSRVHAMHARKMAARLQAATASDPGERPILLWVDQDAGHG